MFRLLLKNSVIRPLSIFFIFLSLCINSFSYDFAGGTGEPNNPYQISTAEQLLSIGSDPNLLNKCYILLNDIDLDPNVTGIPPFTQAPIAPDTNPSSDNFFEGTKFTGIFDGNDNKINNLIIDTAGAGNDYLGLFGFIDGSSAQVKNLGMENAAITSGSDSCVLGGLCGANVYGTLSNCYSTGSVSGDFYFGGLCGTNVYGTLSNCYSSGSVSGDDSYGGLCGYNSYGTVSNCYSIGQVTGGTNSDELGGLCGINSGTIINCYSIRSVTGDDYLGGLCGKNINGTLSNCYSSGQITGGSDSQWLGGLCGENYNGTIINCYSIGSVSGYDSLGGLCGYNYNGIFSNCYATGSVSGGIFLGGLCGVNHYGTISNCYSSGQVTGGTDSHSLGGLCGYNEDGTISNCYSNGQVNSGDNSEYLGGLCGRNDDTISNCYSSGQVTAGASSMFLGGLCGDNTGTLINCYSSGQVTGGSDSWYLGGLCGENYRGTISNCYATGSVSGDDYLGGFCGYNRRYGTLINCYSIGSVTGDHNKGGFCGYDDNGSFTGCFWDVNVSDIKDGVGNLDPDPNGVYGRTTDQMQMLTTFTDYDWDFVGESDNGTEDIWRMCVDGVSYPKLFLEFTSGDLICPDGVDFLDFAFVADYWLNSNCAILNDCDRTDFDLSGSVDSNDLNIFTSHWLQN